MIKNGFEQAKKFKWSFSSFEHLKVLEYVLKHSKLPQQKHTIILQPVDNINSAILNTLKAQS